MNDDRLTAALWASYRGTTVAPPDADAGLDAVMTRVRQTRQRGRWWPLPTPRRATVGSPVLPGPSRPAATPATYVCQPIVIWRTRAMFTPLKALTAVALASAIGSVLLIAPPFGQQGGLVPGAAEPSPTAGVDRGGVKGEIVTATQRCDPDSFGFIPDEAAADGSGTWSLECTHTASDPRVTGPLMVTVVYDLSTPNDTGQGILVADIALQGPDGEWTGREYRTVIDPPTGPGRVLWILSGNGAYDGWVYIASADQLQDAATFFDYDTSGVIYEGALPPSFWPEG